MTSRHIVLTTFGSFGDLHPTIAIALELQRRGHRATIATSAIYREKVEALGLGFGAVRPDLPDPTTARDVVRQVMDLRRGGEYLFKQMLMPHLRESYDDLSAIARDADLLVTHPVTFAGPIVAQQQKLRWASTVLAPISFFSIYDPPVPPAAPELAVLFRLGPGVRRVLIGLMRRVTERWVAPVYALRRELGLPRGGHPLFEGQHSPQRVLALFSRALGEPQPDWPHQTRQCGFAFYDRRGSMSLLGKMAAMEHQKQSTSGESNGAGNGGQHTGNTEGLSPALARFLEAGPAPVVFTLGSSAVMDAGSFYRESARAARRLKRRAVLLIGDAINLPKQLPPGVVAFDYAPYSALFPRAAAVVHQGGAGTTAQAMRAGVPQFVMPYSHDQPDHAVRIERLGIGLTISRARYRADRVAPLLDQLLKNSQCRARAAAIGAQVRREDGVGVACDALEEQLCAEV